MAPVLFLSGFFASSDWKNCSSGRARVGPRRILWSERVRREDRGNYSGVKERVVRSAEIALEWENASTARNLVIREEIRLIEEKKERRV